MAPSKDSTIRPNGPSRREERQEQRASHPIRDIFCQTAMHRRIVALSANPQYAMLNLDKLLSNHLSVCKLFLPLSIAGDVEQDDMINIFTLSDIQFDESDRSMAGIRRPNGLRTMIRSR